MTSVADEVRRPLDRRVRRTQKALRDAFISLVLERGYDHVLIEDITDRADVARATFYAHYADKDALFATLFAEFSAELTAMVSEPRETDAPIRLQLYQKLFEDAYASRDLYRLCLSGAGNGRARASFENLLAEEMHRQLVTRVEAAPFAPRVPVELIARAMAGAITASLYAWLNEDDPIPVEQAARYYVTQQLYGAAWAWGAVSDDVIATMPKVSGLTG